MLPCPDAVALELTGNADPESAVPLETGLETLVDPTGKLTIEDVSASSMAAAFQPRSSPGITTPRNNAAIWVRFTLGRDVTAPRDWILEASPAWLDELTLYSPAGNNASFTSIRIGDRYLFSERPVQSVLPAFPVYPDTTPRAYYLRLKTDGTTWVELRLWQHGAQFKNERNRLAVYSALAGALAVVTLMSMIFFFLLRNRLHWVLSVFALAVAAHVFVQSGYGNPLIFPDSPWVSDRTTPAVLCVLMLIDLGLSSWFFNFRHHYVWGRRLILALSGFFALAAVLVMVGKGGPIMSWILYASVASAIVNCVLLVSLIVVKRQYQFTAPALVLGLFNLVWGGYGTTQISDLVFVNLDLFTLLIATLIALFTVVVLTMVSQSLEMKRHLHKEQQNALEFARVARQATEDKIQQNRFVAMVSHEFRTPLAIIDAIAHALTSSPAGRDEHVKTSLGKIRKAVSRLSLLVNNILVNDSLETSVTQKSLTTMLDIRALLQSWGHDGLTRPGEGSRLQLDLPPAALMVDGNALYIETILDNLLENAFKYAAKDTPIKVRAGAQDHWVQIDVCNEGPAISETDKAALFERYFRGARSTGVPGSGLGLHIARTIARRHGGDLFLHASDGQQTVFRLLLPISNSDKDDEQ
ncbi:MAG: sensor histidine kinase [Zoogloeaceae bacterium]|nr:sensor histidine kinase [Zoogloeaceae bacterium]